MKKYKVQFRQTEHFTVDVYAENGEQAIEKATEFFNAGAYHEDGDCEVVVRNTFDVTNTDDPFDPFNSEEL